jgi:RNA polymerase sigma-70 factor (ECF subfamily)
MSSARETFESLRPLLFAIAYRMLASVSDAEDVLQEAYLRYRRALDDGVVIASLKAYLSTVVTRLAMDQLRSARQRREEYVGVWLPEPLLTDGSAGGLTSREADDPLAHAEMADSLSMAFLLVLERLSPVERAVFLLHDVFGYGHEEIAAIVGTSTVNTRQIASRARQRVRADRPRFDPSLEERDRLAERFFAAVIEGDLDGLVQVLADDVVVYGDGGGKAPQWSAPIVGVDRVSRLFAGLGRQMRELGLRIEPRRVNGQPGAVVRDAKGGVVNVFALDVGGGAVRTVRSVINPDKLGHLGRVADVRALAAKRISERSSSL